MRVLVVSHGHPAFSIGGAEVASHALFRGLDAMDGIEAHYLARTGSPVARHEETPLMSLRQGPRETFVHLDAYDHRWIFPRRAFGELAARLRIGCANSAPMWFTSTT